MPASVEKKTVDGESVSFYPNCDVNVWLRSCENEEPLPVEGTLSGELPVWLKGCLLRNGPGCFNAGGNEKFKHLFDSSALMHRFCISNGNVTYQRRLLQTKAFKRNHAAQRIVVTEFGTKAVPDPCQSIFQTVAAIFVPGESLSDNAMISIYPFGDEYYAFTESPIVHRIDPRTLETKDRINLSDFVSIVNHTSHPLVMQDQTVYNIGLRVTATGPRYQIVEFPPSDSKGVGKMFEAARHVGSVSARWGFNPSYMHTFGITDNYFVIIEQPLTVSVPALVKNAILGEPMMANMRWYPNEQTYFYLVSRETGQLKHTFATKAFFYLHTINTFELRDTCIVDICAYQDPAMIDCMYVDSMQGAQTNPDYAALFRGKPMRFSLPLDSLNKSERMNIEPEILSNFGCETPRVHMERYLGKPYRYFYAISSDVDMDNPGTIIKVDIQTKSALTWCENLVYPSEPIFVPAPDPQSEDDGVILSALVWGGEGRECQVALLVLDAKNMTELARCTFETGGPVPKCLHGWFANDVV
ncbi:carotenoid isomerooxygenase [Neocloeon triangulifer]|uniref:carotenoid isomerooxygenase n=1 Tax=Neocloeon triangulifer TaxID=2078957 RepID=UPI00286F0767|nr:carotenoid isomerooxygenase [Neocloeon triangulifer]